MKPEPMDAADEAAAALAVIEGYFPPEDRERVRLGFLDRMAAEFAASGMEPPEWIEELRRRNG